MLTRLDRIHITNLAVIDELNVEFGPGLNVVTGPTGSGKTLLIDSLKLALGNRANYDLLTADRDARIEVVFSGPGDDGRIDFGTWDEKGELNFVRELNQDRSSPARLNGERIRLKGLREKRTRLIDFHGQHENQAIFEPHFARAVLDRYGNYRETLDEYRDRYDIYSELESELETLTGDNSELEQRLELLEYQVEELDDFEPDEGEWEDIEERRRKLESAEEIERALSEAVDLLDGERSLPTKVDQLIGSLSDIEDFDPELQEWIEEVNDVRVIFEELRRHLKENQSELSGSRQDYDEVMSRRSRWLELARKHDVPPENLYDHYRDKKEEIESLRNREDRREEITARLDDLETELYDIAGTLHENRQETADRLEDTVEEVLGELNLSEAEFQIRVREDELGPHGYDEVVWLFASHSTQALGPLSSRVSGGEISRVLLAIKSALAEADRTPVLVFDEIDTGISGQEAEQVGAVLEDLAQYHQVLCITHLPLVASKADQHIRISREDQDDRVIVEADKLREDSRIDEISRLLSGDESSSVSREQARELLES
ncbi:MAG: DNA repair protein RecN [bacterium]